MTGGYRELVWVGVDRRQFLHMLGENGKAGRDPALSVISIMNWSVAEEMQENWFSAYSFPW